MRSLLILALLTGCATTSSPAPPADETPEPAFDAVGTMAAYLSGAFDSEQQSLDDPRFFAISLVTCAVSAPELGETVLYIEQAVLDTPDEPYRQRLYVVEGDEDPRVAHTAVFSLVDPDAAIGLCEGDLGEFEGEDVTLREGCGVHSMFDEDEQVFVGGTEGTDCSSTLGGAEYATSEVTIGPDLLESWDRGWDAHGDQAWGAVAGPYRFVRAAGD